MSYVKACAMAIVGALGLASANQAQAITMAELTAPGASPVVVGDKIFSDFSYLSATLPADQVAVNFVNNGDLVGIQFGAGWNTVTYGPIMDSVIGYTITVDPGSGNVISGAGLSMAGLVVTSGGTATVGETITNPSTGQEYNLQVVYDGPGGVDDDTSDFTDIDPGANQLIVIKDINVAAVENNDRSFASVTFVDNTFVQTPGQGTPPPVIPEPMSLALLPLALVGLGLRKKLAR